MWKKDADKAKPTVNEANIKLQNLNKTPNHQPRSQSDNSPKFVSPHRTQSALSNRLQIKKQELAKKRSERSQYSSMNNRENIHTNSPGVSDHMKSPCKLKKEVAFLTTVIKKEEPARTNSQQSRLKRPTSLNANQGRIVNHNNQKTNKFQSKIPEMTKKPVMRKE